MAAGFALVRSAPPGCQATDRNACAIAQDRRGTRLFSIPDSAQATRRGRALRSWQPSAGRRSRCGSGAAIASHVRLASGLRAARGKACRHSQGLPASWPSRAPCGCRAKSRFLLTPVSRTVNAVMQPPQHSGPARCWHPTPRADWHCEPLHLAHRCRTHRRGYRPGRCSARRLPRQLPPRGNPCFGMGRRCR